MDVGIDIFIYLDLDIGRFVQLEPADQIQTYKQNIVYLQMWNHNTSSSNKLIVLSDLNILIYLMLRAALWGRFCYYPILQIRKLRCWVSKLLKVAQILGLGFELGSVGLESVLVTWLYIASLYRSLMGKSIFK